MASLCVWGLVGSSSQLDHICPVGHSRFFYALLVFQKQHERRQAPVHTFLLWISLLMSCWPKQVTWVSPGSVWEGVYIRSRIQRHDLSRPLSWWSTTMCSQRSWVNSYFIHSFISNQVHYQLGARHSWALWTKHHTHSYSRHFYNTVGGVNQCTKWIHKIESDGDKNYGEKQSRRQDGEFRVPWLWELHINWAQQSMKLAEEKSTGCPS